MEVLEAACDSTGEMVSYLRVEGHCFEEELGAVCTSGSVAK